MSSIEIADEASGGKLLVNAETLLVGCEVHQHISNECTHGSGEQSSNLTQDEIEALSDQLKHELLKSVEVATDQPAYALHMEQAIAPVTLPMCNEPTRVKGDFDAEGHFHRRKDLSQVYQSSAGDVSCTEMFDLALQSATEAAERQCQSVAAKEAYILKHANTVGVVGQAGIGKTTTVKKWVKSISRGSILPQVSFLILIFVRAMNFTNEGDLLECLLTCYLPSWQHSKATDLALLKVLSEDPNVVIAIDGLDEAAVANSSLAVPKVNLYDRADAWTFLLNIIGGNLLPKAKKIVTSRPAQLYNIHPSIRPHFMIQILGLDAAARDQIGLQVCGEHYPRIKKALQGNASVFAYCYVPVNFILTLNYFMQTDDKKDFICLTGILTFTMGSYMRSGHLNGREIELEKLAKMAWNGCRKTQIFFDSRDFKEAGLQEDSVRSFLSTAVTQSANFKLKILAGDRRSFFSHLIWQEFFAAVYLMCSMPLAEFTSAVEDMKGDGGKLEVVTKFAFGLCNPDLLNDLQSSYPCQPLELLQEKKTLLVEVALSRIGRISIDYRLTGALQVCAWLNEAHDDVMTRDVVAAFSAEIRLGGSFFPSDASNLMYVVALSPKGLNIDLRGCRFVDDSFARLTSLVAELPNPLEQLILSTAKGSLYGSWMDLICSCLHKIRKLYLHKCNIGPKAVKQLADKLESNKIMMEKLQISNNAFGDEGATEIARAIPWLNSLLVQNCGITEVGARALAANVAKLQTPMYKLYLGINRIKNDGAKSLAACVHNISKLDVRYCWIEDEGIDAIASRVQTLERPLQKLMLTKNTFGPKSCEAISLAVGSISHLSMGHCDGFQLNLKVIAKGIKRLSKPMHTLHLKAIDLDQMQMKVMANCLRNIQRITINDCRLGPEEVKLMAKYIHKLPVKMQNVILQRNTLEDDSAIYLSRCLHNIGILELSNCKITSRGAIEIAKQIQKLKTPMESLNLSGNDINRGVGELIIALPKIKELDISWCGIQSSCIQAIAENVSCLDKKMEFLDLSGNQLNGKAVLALLDCSHNIEKLRIWYTKLDDQSKQQVTLKLRPMKLQAGQIEMDGL